MYSIVGFLWGEGGGGGLTVLCHKVFSIINFVLIRGGWLPPRQPTLEAK